MAIPCSRRTLMQCMILQCMILQCMILRRMILQCMILKCMILRCMILQCKILQCMILLAGILCISSILQVVKQRNGGMGRKPLLHSTPSCSLSWYSSWSYSLFIIAFVISFVFYFCKFQQHGTKRQEVGTVKGVVWEEERLPIQHIFYSNRILLAIITMQGMISHTMYSQWCLK